MTTVQELIDRLQECNPKAAVTFSIEDESTDDACQRWFAENGIQFIMDNGHPELPKDNATVVTIGLLVKSNS